MNNYPYFSNIYIQINKLPRVMKHYSPTSRRNHGRPMKRLLGTWEGNGSTSGPTPWQIYDDDDEINNYIYIYMYICTYISWMITTLFPTFVKHGKEVCLQQNATHKCGFFLVWASFCFRFVQYSSTFKQCLQWLFIL